jgi:hypothetical protein
MTQQEIQERNKQIALMLGAIYSSNGEAWGFGNAKNIGSKMFNGVMYKDVIQAERFEKELKFHSDWNWLIEAVEFIEKLGGSYNISNKSCAISVNEPYWYSQETVVKTDNPTKEAVFTAVSDFAKLHNEGEIYGKH